jgi:NAD+ diphosphatase
MAFITNFNPPPTETASALWFIFHHGKLMTKMKYGTYSIPKTSDLEEFYPALIRKQYIGALDGHPCFAAELTGSDKTSVNFEFKELRALFGLLKEELIWVAGRANQLVDWNQAHQYCGRCGSLNQEKSDERAKICPEC